MPEWRRRHFVVFREPLDPNEEQSQTCRYVTVVMASRCPALCVGWSAPV